MEEVRRCRVYGGRHRLTGSAGQQEKSIGIPSTKLKEVGSTYDVWTKSTLLTNSLLRPEASSSAIVAINRPRARASRDITVPIGIPVTSAISR
jgi:hypothetical protein